MYLPTLGFDTIGASFETASLEISVTKDLAMRCFRCLAICFLIMLSFGAPGIAQETEEHVHAFPGSEEGLGRAHMEISCSPGVAARFDRALALLHNFWYGRALEGFRQVSNVDPECAIA